MEVGSVFITGANRGIGLELVRQLVHSPNPPKYVFATYRNDGTAETLKEIKDSSKKCQVLLIKMDVNHPEEVEGARRLVEEAVGEDGLNWLINNAAALKAESFPHIKNDNMLFHFETNTLGPITVLKKMLPLLQKAATRQQISGLGISRATVLNISSMGGSIAWQDGTKPSSWLPAMGYRISKAALNMAMRIITQEIQDSGILVVMMCPGWVKTDMGSQAAELEIADSVSAILKTCILLNETHQGAFMDRNGKTIPF